MVARLLRLGVFGGLIGAASVQGMGQTALPDAPQAAVAPQPDAQGVYHQGDGVTAPKLIYQVEPEFPETARRKSLSAKCTVAAVVGVDGLVKEVVTTRSSADQVSPKLRSLALKLDEEARKAVRQYRFEAGRYQGKAVPVRVTIDVDFEIW